MLSFQQCVHDLRLDMTVGPEKGIPKTMGWYQSLVSRWMNLCFANTHRSISERCYRFIEEALELVQSLGCTKEQVLVWVDYVYSRPVGEPAQEVGGVMVTLAALCDQARLDLSLAATAELYRISDEEAIKKIRAKQVTKNSLIGKGDE